MLARYVGAIDDDPDAPETNRQHRRPGPGANDVGGGVVRQMGRDRRAEAARRRRGQRRSDSTPPATGSSVGGAGPGSAVALARGRSASTGPEPGPRRRAARDAGRRRRREPGRQPSQAAQVEVIRGGAASGGREGVPHLNTEMLSSSGAGQGSFSQPALVLSETTYFNGTTSLQRPHWSLTDMSELTVGLWAFPTEQQENRDRFYRKDRPVGLQERMAHDGMLSGRDSADAPALARWRVLLQKGDDVTGDMTGRSGRHGSPSPGGGGGGGCTPTLLWHPVTGRLRLCVTTLQGQTTVVESTATVLAGQWSHIVFTIGRGELKLYVRGRCDVSRRGGQALLYNQSPLCIGALPQGSGTGMGTPAQTGFVGYLHGLQLLSDVSDLVPIPALPCLYTGPRASDASRNLSAGDDPEHGL